MARGQLKGLLDDRGSTGVEVRVLGSFALQVDGATVQLPAQVQKVVAFLALNEGAQSRERVAAQLWPDVDRKRGMASLRTAVWRVGKGCPDVIRSLRHVLGLDPAVRVDLREAQAAAHRVLDCGRVDPELAMPLLSARLLPDWGDQWVLLEQQRVQQMHAQCLEILGYQLLDEQRYVHAMQAAVAACRMEPLRESARRAVVDVLVAEGNGLLASQVQKAFRELLQAELG